MVDMALLILKILPLSLAFKFGLIPLWIMDYSPWGSENDGLKIFMQVEVDILYKECKQILVGMVLVIIESVLQSSIEPAGLVL